MRQNFGKLQGAVSRERSLQNKLLLPRSSRNGYWKAQEKGAWKEQGLGKEFQRAEQGCRGSLEQQEGARAEEPLRRQGAPCEE